MDQGWSRWDYVLAIIKLKYNEVICSTLAWWVAIIVKAPLQALLLKRRHLGNPRNEQIRQSWFMILFQIQVISGYPNVLRIYIITYHGLITSTHCTTWVSGKDEVEVALVPAGHEWPTRPLCDTFHLVVLWTWDTLHAPVSTLNITESPNNWRDEGIALPKPNKICSQV